MTKLNIILSFSAKKDLERFKFAASLMREKLSGTVGSSLALQPG